MNEEELFCKLFPEYAVNGKPLSPYFDLFESGLEQAENRIAELKKTYRKQRNKKIDELQKKNAELKADFLKACKVKEQGFREAEQALERKDEQLTKAKEILKHMLNSFVGDLPRNLGYFDEEELKAIADVEQFLNSEPQNKWINPARTTNDNEIKIK